LAGFERNLLADHVAELSPRAGDHNHAANAFRFLGGHERDERPLAVPQQPDAFGSGLLADRGDPAVRVGRVIGDRNLVRIGNRRLASEQPPLIDPHARHAFGGERFGEEAIGRRRDAQRVIAVAVCWT
jgi:hypothetical protein